MDNTLLIVLNIVSWLISFILFLFYKNYLPSYFQEKGKNLATKEDINEITITVEFIKSDYARQLELYKNEIALLDKRRELSAQVVDLINKYKEIPSVGAKDEQLRIFEQQYYELNPWIPSDILKSLNNLFAKSEASHKKPDVKDVIISVRKSILREESGDFTGEDIVNFVGFRK